MDFAGVLANSVTEKLIKTAYESEETSLKEAGLALWFIARSAETKEVARSAAEKIVDKIGLELVIEGALHGESLLHIGAAVQRISNGLF